MNYDSLDDKDTFTAQTHTLAELEAGLEHCLRRAEAWRLRGNAQAVADAFLEEAANHRRKIVEFFAARLR